LFRDYESQFGKEVQDFEDHMEDVQAGACLCDARRLKELRENQEAHHKELGRMVEETREIGRHLQRHADFVMNSWEREQDLRERSYIRLSFYGVVEFP
jgi:hypothetical protein